MPGIKCSNKSHDLCRPWCRFKSFQLTMEVQRRWNSRPDLVTVRHIYRNVYSFSQWKFLLVLHHIISINFPFICELKKTPTFVSVAYSYNPWLIIVQVHILPLHCGKVVKISRIKAINVLDFIIVFLSFNHIDEGVPIVTVFLACKRKLPLPWACHLQFLGCGSMLTHILIARVAVECSTNIQDMFNCPTIAILVLGKVAYHRFSKS